MTEDHPGPAASEEGGVFDHIVLGGGLAGLTLGLNLARAKPREKVLVLEAAPEVGGLARTTLLDRVVFDFGPHVLRDRDGHTITRLSPQIKFLPFHTSPSTFKHGCYFDHVIPVVTRANIDRLPVDVRSRVLEEVAGLPSKETPGDESSFGAYVDSRLGRALSWEFFGQYSRKWWGVDPRELHVQLAPRGVMVGERASYTTVATDFSKPTHEYYPEIGGFGAIVKDLRAQVLTLTSSNLTLRTGSAVNALEMDGDRVRRVLTAGGGAFEVRGSVCSTIPLTRLGSLLGVRVPLRFRAEIGVFLTARREASKDVPSSWTYSLHCERWRRIGPASNRSCSAIFKSSGGSGCKHFAKRRLKTGPHRAPGAIA